MNREKVGAVLGPLQPAEGERLGDVVFSTIREAIFSGSIAAGSRLTETELVDALEVSRTPVREALRGLEADGIVSSSPRQGYVVVDFLEDASLVFAIRKRLEGLAGALAAQRITVPELDHLKSVQHQMEQHLNDGSKGSLETLSELNAEFHHGITQAAEAPRLQRLIEQLIPTYISHQVVVLYSDEERKQSFEGHRQILDALWKRDGEMVDCLVREHLGQGEKVVLNELLTKAGSG